MTRSSRGLLLVLVTLSACGCGTTWQAIRKDRIAEVVNRSQPDRALVETGGSVLEIRHPAVRADTLRGTIRAEHGRRPIQVPLASVDTLSLYRNRASTAVVGVSIAASFLLLAVLLAHQEPPSIY